MFSLYVQLIISTASSGDFPITFSITPYRVKFEVWMCVVYAIINDPNDNSFAGNVYTPYFMNIVIIIWETSIL